MSSKVTKARPAAAVDRASVSPSPAQRPSLLHMFATLLSPSKRTRVEPATPVANATPQTPSGRMGSGKSRQSSSNKSTSAQMASRRKSLTNMLGGDVAFQSFTGVAQKVFNTPLAVVVHINPTTGGAAAGGGGGLRQTMASKGGSIDRVKYDGMKRDANSRFYAIFPEVRLRTFPRVVGVGG